MSKDSSAGGGANIGLQELIRMNPALIEQMQQSNMPSMPAETQAEQAMIRTTTPDAIASFYGSGDEIVQPDQSYFQDFALPGVQMERPDPNQPMATQDGASEAADSRAADEAQRLAAIERRRALIQQQIAERSSGQAPRGGRYRQSGSLRSQGLLGYQQQEQEPANEGMGVAPSMPILDMAGGTYQPAVMPQTGRFIPEPETMPYMGVPDFRNFNMRGMR